MMPKQGWMVLSPAMPWKLILPKNIKNQHISDSSTYLHFGHQNEKYPFTIIKKTSLNTKHAYPIRIKKINNNYKLGPIVGILTTEGKRGIKGNKKNFIDLIKAGYKTGILLYVFSAEKVNKEEKRVRAYFYLQEENRWIARIMPLPDVIYNRIPSRKEENKPCVQSILQFFEKENIPTFNPAFFNKWSLYHWLKESPELSTLLPNTSKLTKLNLSKSLAESSMLYLKPINGKAGIGFLRLEKKSNKYHLTFQNAHMVYQQELSTFTTLWQKVLSLTKTQEYIIQTGIKLNTYGGNPFDIRVLVQKNGLGKWMVTGIGVRVAGNQSITTHVPRGGQIASAEQVFSSVYGNQITDKLKEQITALSIRIAKHIERKVNHNLGEVSLDLGIDQEGNAWFFEANSKPMEFDEPEIRQVSLLRLMQYFRYLSGFVPNEVI